jgi:hypothetical protein
MMRAVPSYKEPADFTVDGEWEVGEESGHEIEPEERTITIEMKGDKKRPRVNIGGWSDYTAKEFWTAVHFLREYGVTGVYRETLRCGGKRLRLGALYCIAVENGGMEFTERETNYMKYGEHPYVSD